MSESSKPSAVRHFSMWVLNAPWQEPTASPDHPSELAAHYRSEASRLVGLAVSSPMGETKDDFLRLALHYESLAAHAVQRSRRS